MTSFDYPTPVFIAERGVEIRAKAGEIRMNTADLVEQHGDAFLDCLMDRALSMDVVHAVAIDRRRAHVTIEYDASERELAATLTEIANALRGDPPVRSPDFQVTFNWKALPGVVTRVDRLRTIAGETVRPAGKPGIAGWFRGLSRDRTRRLDCTAAVLQGIVVHYAPPDEQGDDGDDADTETDSKFIVAEAGPSTELIGAPEADISRGWRRLADLAAAGGCFTLTIIGFITPGIPTVPFVLGTSYFLARSFPALNDRLRESYLFGRMVCDWEEAGGMRLSTKVRTLALMFGFLGVTVLVAGATGPVLATTTAVGAVDLALILLIPTIPDEGPLENAPVAALAAV